MKNVIGKILVILTLIKNIIIRKNKYMLHFKYKFDGFKQWYYDWDADHIFKWAFDENNLEMVSGTDGICEYLSDGRQHITVDIIASRYPISNETVDNKYVKFVRKPLVKGLINRCILGANYVNKLDNTIIWICPVTLFVLGRYPKYLYIKHNESYYNKINKNISMT